jgi:predicted enzyme related to lactoylglutathione lyase
MAVLRVGEINIHATDPATSRRFWSILLGREFEDCGIGWGCFVAGTLFLVEPLNSNAAPPPFRLTLHVDDVEASLAELRAAGFKADKYVGPADFLSWCDFHRFGFATDPDGNRVCLLSPNPNQANHFRSAAARAGITVEEAVAEDLRRRKL